MQLQSSENVTKLFAQSATPVIYDIKECFLFDLNFASAKYLFATHILTTIVNFVFSASAIGGNSIVIFSVWKTPSLQTPSNVFICCLAFSDLAVGLLTQPCFVVLSAKCSIASKCIAPQECYSSHWEILQQELQYSQ